MNETRLEKDKYLNNLIEAKLYRYGASFVYFVDISGLPQEQTRNFPTAILLGISLSKVFIGKVTDDPDYVEKLKISKDFESDEFNQKEMKADRLADKIENYLTNKGFSAVSQSENNNIKTGVYCEDTKTSLLPHKTIALIAGLGWIGKNNLLITEDYGCAFCMCSILTDAPLLSSQNTYKHTICSDCRICKVVCPTNAIKGTLWNPAISRDDMVDVKNCKTCLKCMMFCPWTQNYLNRKND